MRINIFLSPAITGKRVKGADDEGKKYGMLDLPGESALYGFHDIINLNGIHTVAVSAFAMVAGTTLHVFTHHYMSWAIGTVTIRIGGTKEGDGGSVNGG